MKFIVYALLLAIIFLPAWGFACWACTEGPLKYLDVSWKMAVGAALQMITSKIVEGIHDAIFSSLS